MIRLSNLQVFDSYRGARAVHVSTKVEYSGYYLLAFVMSSGVNLSQATLVRM